MVLYFFSSDIPSLVIQVLGTVSRCKHKLPKTGLVFPPEGCIFLFFFLGGEENLLQAQKQSVDMLTFLSHFKGKQKNGGRGSGFLTPGGLFQISWPKFDCGGLEASLPLLYSQ